MISQSIQNKRDYKLVIGLVVGMTVLSLYFKISNFNYWPGDYEAFLSNWIGELRYNQGFNAFHRIFYNYTPLYVYFLAFISYFHFDVYGDLYAIKVFSILFEYLIAYFIGKIAVHITKNKLLFILSFGIIPLIPSVMIDSALMAQCDSIFVSMILGSIYFLLCRKNNFLAIVFLGIAFSLKLQSSVILPFYFLYMLRGQIKWYYFLMIPLVYLLALVPALCFGAPFDELLKIYLGQSSYSYELSSFFSNFYYLIPNYVFETNKIPGLIFITVFILLITWLLSKNRYKFTLTLWVHFAFFSVIFCPFFLPGMRERALYSGDVLVVLYVMLYPKNICSWLTALALWFVSFFGYALALENIAFYDLSGFDHSFFAFFKVLKWKFVCLLYLAIIIHVFYDFMKKLKANSKIINQSK